MPYFCEMKYPLICIVVLLLFSLHAIAQSQLLNDVEYLSSDSMKGRLVGTPENHVAALFIAARFKSLHLKSFNTDYLDSFTYTLPNNKQIKGANVLAYLQG